MLLALLSMFFPPAGPRYPDGPPRCAATDVAWNGASQRIYLSGNVQCTLSELRKLLPAEAPLTEVEPHVWLLGATLFVDDGATLVVDGAARGGDADELRLRSDNRSGADAFVELRAEWGTLLIRGTRVTSWDTATNAPDEEYERNGRAFIRAVSFLEGSTARESRMDVVDSEIAYLGYYAAESYGLVWKVRDTQGPSVFDVVDVRGSLINSKVHHNYFGMYSYGAYGMDLVGNEVHDNVMYGLDPHDDSDALLVEDNFMHHNGNHGFICSKRCDGLVVRNNVSSDNRGIGFMFHRAVERSILEGNLAERNAEAGIALMDCHDNVVRRNVVRGNQHGIRLSVGSSDNLIEDNDVYDSTGYGIYLYQGTDAPTINDGQPTRNTFRGNVLTGNKTSLRANTASDNRFEDNVFADAGPVGFLLSSSDGNVFSGNEMGAGAFYVEGVVTNVLEDIDAARVWIGGSGSVVEVRDTRGWALVTDRAIGVRVDGEGSSMRLTRAEAAAAVSVRSVPLRVEPSEGELDLVLDSWSGHTRAWRTTPTGAAMAVFALEGLSPGAELALSIDGVPVERLVADGTGVASFSAAVGDAPHSFLMEQDEVRPAPVGRPKP